MYVFYGSTNGMSRPAFTPQSQSITALWPVLISRSTKEAEMARLTGLHAEMVCPLEDGHQSQY